jgi:hypothetical protein
MLRLMTDENATQAGNSPGAVMAETIAVTRRLIEGLLNEPDNCPVQIAKAFESKLAVDSARGKLRNGTNIHLVLGADRRDLRGAKKGLTCRRGVGLGPTRFHCGSSRGVGLGPTRFHCGSLLEWLPLPLRRPLAGQSLSRAVVTNPPLAQSCFIGTSPSDSSVARQ